MAITVNAAVTAATVSSTKPRASVQYVNPQTSVVSVVAAADVSYIYMAVDAQLDVRGLYPVVLDTVYPIDAASLAFAKSFSESFTQSDEVLPFDLGKGLAEAPSTSELTTFFLGRSIEESATAAEQAALGLTKAPFTDAFTQADTSSLGYGAVHTELVNTQDGGQEFEGDYYADPTYFAEKYVSENRPLIVFFKSILDVVDATDDFDGEVTSEDDQTSVFGKSLSDTAYASDVLSFVADYLRDLNDSFTSADALINLIDKALTDTTATADSLSSDVSKTASDSASTADSGYLYLSSYVDPTYFASDYAGTYQPF